MSKLARAFADAIAVGLPVTVAQLHAHMVTLGREVSVDTIQRDIRSGRLLAIMLGRTFVIPAASAAEYATTREPYDRLRHKPQPESPGKERE